MAAAFTRTLSSSCLEAKSVAKFLTELKLERSASSKSTESLLLASCISFSASSPRFLSLQTSMTVPPRFGKPRFLVVKVRVFAVIHHQLLRFQSTLVNAAHHFYGYDVFLCVHNEH